MYIKQQLTTMSNYNNGKIYKIYNTITDEIYIGATTRLLCERMQSHIAASRSEKRRHLTIYKCFNEHGVSNFYIELIENYNCNSRKELYAKEGHYIRELKPSLNKIISGRTPVEYREDNKDRIKERGHIHYRENKEKIAEQIIQYRQVNKEKVAEQTKRYYIVNKEQAKQYYIVNKEKMAEQTKQYYIVNKEQAKQYRQVNKEKIAEQAKQYYIVNKEQIAERTKQYYEVNKNKINEQQKQYYNFNKERKKQENTKTV